jgi:chromosome segregation ATPase
MSQLSPICDKVAICRKQEDRLRQLIYEKTSGTPKEPNYYADYTEQKARAEACDRKLETQALETMGGDTRSHCRETSAAKQAAASERMEALEAANLELRQSVRNLKDENTGLQNELRSLKDKARAEAAPVRSQRVTRAMDLTAPLRTKNDELTATNTQLETELREQQTIVSNLKDTLEKLRTKLLSQENDHSAVLESGEATLASTIKQLKTMKTTEKQHLTQIEILTRENAELKSARDQQDDGMQSLASANRALQNQVVQLDHFKTSVEAAYTDVQGDNDAVTEEDIQNVFADYGKTAELVWTLSSTLGSSVDEDATLETNLKILLATVKNLVEQPADNPTAGGVRSTRRRRYAVTE